MWAKTVFEHSCKSRPVFCVLVYTFSSCSVVVHFLVVVSDGAFLRKKIVVALISPWYNCTGWPWCKTPTSKLFCSHSIHIIYTCNNGPDGKWVQVYFCVYHVHFSLSKDYCRGTGILPLLVPFGFATISVFIILLLLGHLCVLIPSGLLLLGKGGHEIFYLHKHLSAWCAHEG